MWPAAAGTTLTLTGVAIAGLPRTARNAVEDWPAGVDVSARCTDCIPLPGDLSLFAFDVATLPGVEPAVPAGDAQAPAPAPAGTAREQFLAAAARLRERTGQDVLRRQDLINEVIAGGTSLSLNTLGQTITMHLCVEPGQEGYGRYADFERVGQGLFRLRISGGGAIGL